MALDWADGSVIWDGQSWSARLDNGIAAYITGSISLSCPTTTMCADGGAGKVSVLSGSTWSAPVTVEPSGTITVSCASETACTAVTQTGDVVTYNGTSWTMPVSIDADPLVGLSCPSAGTCVAADADGRTLVEHAGTWGNPGPDGGGFTGAFSSITCFSVTDCVGLSSDTESVYAFDGSSWSLESGAPSGVSSLTCATATSCLAVINGSVSNWNGSSWSTPQVVQGINYITDVACASPTLCQVGDSEGKTATFNGTSWTFPGWIDSTHPDIREVLGLSCAPDSSCLAILSDGSSAAYRNGSWSTPVTVPGLGANGGQASCLSATFCLLVQDGKGWTYDGQHWSTPNTFDPGGGDFMAVSCATTTFCIATDHAIGSWFRYDGTGWSGAHPVGTAYPDVSSIDCASATLCLGWASTPTSTDPKLISIETFNGSTWNIGQKLDGITAFGCASVSFCVAMDYSSATYIYDGATWLDRTPGPMNFSTNARSPGPMTCPTDQFCMAGDSYQESVFVGRAS